MQWRFKGGRDHTLFGGVCVGVCFLDGHVASEDGHVATEDGQKKGGSSMEQGTDSKVQAGLSNLL